MKYIPGNVFVNTTVSSLSEVSSHVTTYFLFKRYGPRKCLIYCYFISALTAFLLILAESAKMVSVVPILVLGAKFGVSAAFLGVYMANVKIFPTEYLGTIFGICNVVARGSTILAPMVAEMSNPVPLLAFSLISLTSALAAIKLKEKVDEERD